MILEEERSRGEDEREGEEGMKRGREKARTLWVQQVLRGRNFSIFKGPCSVLSWKRLGVTLTMEM